MMTYTFYIVSDHIQTQAKDIARMNKIAAAFKAMGHKTVVGSRNPNAHTHPEQLKCTGKNDVFVCIFGGVDIEVISDHTGYKQSDWFKKRLKNARLMYIFMQSPEGRAVTVGNKKIGLAHDGKGNIPGFNSIANPASFLKKNGITFLQSGTTDGIVGKIRSNNYEGAGLNLGSNSSSTEVTTTEYTIKHGYDTSNHFQGYLKIDYTVNKKNGTLQTIYVDFCSEAPEMSSIPSFNNSNLIFSNNKKYTNEIPLLEHLKSVHDPKGVKNNKYYLKKVSLVRHFDKTKLSDGQLYDKKTDDSTYKLNLYKLGLSSGEVINQVTLGVAGKTLLDAVDNVLKKCGYRYNMKYYNLRNNDTVQFLPEVDTSYPVHTFNEGIDGDIIGISNVKYSPTSDLINNSMMIYKSKVAEDSEIGVYRYARKARLDDVLRYGEQTHLESLSDTIAFTEASQNAYNNLETYYKPDTTFTVTSVGLPPVDVNDYVETKTITPLLTNGYIVESRRIVTNVDDRPMIRTEFGLGDVDKKLKVKHNLDKQRRELVKAKLDLNEPVHYIDAMSDNFIEYTEEVDNIDYVNYEVWVD